MTSQHLSVRRCLRRWSLGVLCGVVAIATSCAATFELPPLVQPSSSEHHAGKVIWADLITPDLAGTKSFYGGPFGWTFQDIHTGDTDYSIALLDGTPVGGLVQRTARPGDSRRPAWLTFISVQDVDEAERITLGNGGKVLSQPRTHAQRGWQAVFADPQGDSLISRGSKVFAARIQPTGVGTARAEQVQELVR